MSQLAARTPASAGPAKLAAGGAAVAAAAAVAFVLGWTGAFGGEPTGAVLALDPVDVHTCSRDQAPGLVTGQLHRGDRVWMIGTSGEQWLVIRDPQALTSPAWVRSSDVARDGDTAMLPEIDCAQAADLAIDPANGNVPGVGTGATTVPLEPTTTTTTQDVAPDSSVPISDPTPTTAPATPPPTPTTPPPTPTAPAPTPTPAPTTTTTSPPDRTGPDVRVTTDRSLLYSEGTTSCSSYPQRIQVTVTATDPTGPVTTGPVRWSAGALSGNATAIGPNRYEIGPIPSTHGGIVALTITASATDGPGNATQRSITVQFAQIADVCIG